MQRRKHSAWNTKGRSAAFNQYLSRQTPERRAELLAQERTYLRSQDVSGRGVVLVRDFAQGMVGVDAT